MITIATYYFDELTNWNESIIFYENEMDGIEQKLDEVIRRNSVVDIAEKVEAHQTQLNQALEKFYKLLIDIEKQEVALTTNDTVIEDKAINLKMEKQQTDMRRTMYEIEKEYIDVKFQCHSFLSEILKSKKHKS
jgi:hypothetical protein